MSILKLQDATVLIHSASRYNGNLYDEVYVQTSIVTEGPLTDNYYVPAGVSLHAAALELLKHSGLEYRPYHESELLTGTENIFESAKNGDVPDTINDATRLILLSVLKKQPLNLVAQNGNVHVYDLRYSYKIYPIVGAPDSYEFSIRLPFDGITMPNGSKVQLTVVTPSQATIDQGVTKGIDVNGAEIQETVSQLVQTGKMVAEFTYQIDPLFTVRYVYNPGSSLV